MLDYKFWSSADKYIGHLYKAGFWFAALFLIGVALQILKLASFATSTLILIAAIIGMLWLIFRILLATHAFNLANLREGILRLKYPNLYQYPQRRLAERIIEFENDLQKEREIGNDIGEVDEYFLWSYYVNSEKSKGRKEPIKLLAFKSEQELKEKVDALYKKMVPDSAWKLAAELEKLGASSSESSFLLWNFWEARPREFLEDWLNAGFREERVIEDFQEIKEHFLAKKNRHYDGWY